LTFTGVAYDSRKKKGMRVLGLIKRKGRRKSSSINTSPERKRGEVRKVITGFERLGGGRKRKER